LMAGGRSTAKKILITGGNVIPFLLPID